MGGNWKFGHGAVDFAGSGVVHAMGGIIGLAGAICIGPRIGKYIDGKPQAIPGHSLPMAMIGCFILAFGWFGFNPGSTLSGTDLRISHIVVNTMLASVTGALAAMFYLMGIGKKPDPSMLVNGMLAGLVAITAPCAFVNSMGAAIIGAVAGVLVVLSVYFWDKVGCRRSCRCNFRSRRLRSLGRPISWALRHRPIWCRLERSSSRRHGSPNTARTAYAGCFMAMPVS